MAPGTRSLRFSSRIVARAVTGRRGEGGREVLAVDQRSVEGDPGVGHPVVDLQDQVLGAVGAVLPDLVVLEAAILGLERLHDVVNIITVDSVEVEEVGVQLGADDRAAFLIPAEWFSLVAQVSGERSHVVSSVDKFKNSGSDEPTMRLQGFRTRNRKLLPNEQPHARPTDFLTTNIVIDKRALRCTQNNNRSSFPKDKHQRKLMPDSSPRNESRNRSPLIRRPGHITPPVEPPPVPPQ